MIDLLKGRGVVAISCELTSEGIMAGLVVANIDSGSIVFNPENEGEKYPILSPGQGIFYRVLLPFDQGETR